MEYILFDLGHIFFVRKQSVIDCRGPRVLLKSFFHFPPHFNSVLHFSQKVSTILGHFL